MEIKRVAPQNPPSAASVDAAAPTPVFAGKLETTAAKKAAAPDAAATLNLLLDRAAARSGGLPPDAREALKSQLATDPFFQSRLTRFLEKQGE